jgi:undecaprenyl diphosphate synthase
VGGSKRNLFELYDSFLEYMPKTIGVIVDGNRRWAKAKGLSTIEGHKAGLENLRRFFSLAKDVGITNVYAYLFSTENWQRAPQEVSYLMNLCRSLLKDEFLKLAKEGVQIRFLGIRDLFSEDLQILMKKIEQIPIENPTMTIGACLSYGGRAEIVAAANRAIAEGKPVTEESFKELLWSSGMPDPELIVRTGGDKRLSNFLTWQSVYTELFFTETLWPDFSEEEFHSILKEYGERERRHGK